MQGTSSHIYTLPSRAAGIDEISELTGFIIHSDRGGVARKGEALG